MGRIYNNKKQEKLSNGDGGHREETDALPTDASGSSDSEADNKHNGGECEKCTNPHDGKLIMQKQFAFGIDELFTMIFTNCKFNMKLRAFRGVSEYEEIPWQPENGVKCRKMKYILALTSVPMGPKETHVTETHVMNKCSKPGALYSIDSTSENAGIPYADYFSISVHYCLQRVTRSSTMLSFYGQVKYKKSTMFKSFIEKNAINGLSEFCQVLESKLNAEAEPAAPAARKPRGHRRLTYVASSPQQAAPPAPESAAPASLHWLLALVLVLLATNALLCWRLRSGGGGERTADLNDLQNRLSSIQSTQTAEWSRLLELHSVKQRDQLARWRKALHTTVQHLAQTERALTTLLDTIKPSLESAQREAEAHMHSGL